MSVPRFHAPGVVYSAIMDSNGQDLQCAHLQSGAVTSWTAAAPVAPGAVAYFSSPYPRKGKTTLMTLRPPGADGNINGAKSELSGSAPRRALLTLREAAILSGGLLVGLGTGILTYLAVHNLPEAVLAGGPACAAAIKFLDTIISPEQ
jgi:hypothetical protein